MQGGFCESGSRFFVSVKNKWLEGRQNKRKELIIQKILKEQL